jgi:hypothetical protein
MDFEPPKSCDVVEFLRLDQKTFKDRMQVCMANLGGKLTAVDTHIYHFSPKAARVNLATFAAVVSKWGWPIPQQLKALEQHAPTPAPAKATLPDEARAFKPEPQPKPVLEQPPSGAPEQGQAKVVKHITKGQRAHWLDAVLKSVRHQAADPSDCMSVWHSLCGLAQTDSPPEPLMGMVGKSIKRRDGSNHELFDYNAFTKYWERREGPRNAA